MITLILFFRLVMNFYSESDFLSFESRPQLIWWQSGTVKKNQKLVSVFPKFKRLKDKIYKLTFWMQPVWWPAVYSRAWPAARCRWWRWMRCCSCCPLWPWSAGRAGRARRRTLHATGVRLAVARWTCQHWASAGWTGGTPWPRKTCVPASAGWAPLAACR